MKKVCIPRADFIKEHVKLIGILKSGNKARLKSELKEQSKELNSYLRKTKK